MESVGTGDAGHYLSQIVSAVNIAWALKEVEQVKEHLRQFISTADDPMTSLLDLLDHYNPTKGKGHALPALVTCEFQKWIHDHPECQQSGLRLKKLQGRVFPLVTEGNLMDILLSIYKLEEAERSFLLGHVTHLHHTGKYKEAAILSIKLNLQPDLDLEQMCTPLLLLDRFNLLEAYVSGHPKLQSQLLQMLDRWSDSSFNPRKLSKEYQGLPPVKPDKLNVKTLSKLAFRLLETYNLDPALCSNMINQRHLGTLKYLMYKRFVEKTMTQENWADHVQNTVEGNVWLQEQCIALLCRYSDLQTAGFWALKFGMPKEMLPQSVAEILKDLHFDDQLSESQKNPQDSQARKKLFYQLPIPRSKVHFLQNHTELSGCRAAILKDGQIVGVDMEWRPSFGGLGKPNVSLIQLAVKEEVFLLDILQGNFLQSSDPGGRSELVTFIKDLFASSGIKKLGYGMVGDFQGLDATDARFRGLELRSVVDLCEVHKQIQRNLNRPRAPSAPVEVLADASGDDCIQQPEKGLSLLVKDVLGKPLDKTDQLSNWDRRPLREDQVIYAAADAYCLLDVFETLCHAPDKFGLKPNFYEVAKGQASPKKGTGRSPRQKESGRSPRQKESVPKNKTAEPPPKVIPPNSSPQTKAVSPREFSVICDNMLQGLGRYLRCLGVDVLMLENDDDHRKAAEIARRDGRVILTCGLPFQTLRSQIGEGRCFAVDSSEKAREQAVRVLKHFNVGVSLADIFSRCQVCNCDKYLHISQGRMVQLMKLRDYLEEIGGQQDPPHASEPERLCHGENLRWMEEMGISSESLLLTNGAQLQLDAVPAGLLEKVPLFFCCSQCGKIFWEGSHFGRVVSQFKDVLQTNGECIYQSANPQGL